MNEWKDVQVSHPSVGASVYVYSKSMGVIDGMLAHVDCRHQVLTWVVSGKLCYDVTHYHFKEYPDPPLATLKENIELMDSWGPGVGLRPIQWDSVE